MILQHQQMILQHQQMILQLQPLLRFHLQLPLNPHLLKSLQI
jgi:hypothetical protein